MKSLAFRKEALQSESTLILASGSQDSTIRLWNIEPYDRVKMNKPEVASTEQSSNPLSDDLLDAFEASLGDLADEGGRQISLKRHIITVRGTNNRYDQLVLPNISPIATLIFLFQL